MRLTALLFKDSQAVRNKHPYIRKGQALMNALYDRAPALYATITGTEADCFYVDDRIQAFYRFIAENEHKPWSS